MEIGTTNDAYGRYGEARYQIMREDGYAFCDFNMANTEQPVYNCGEEAFTAFMAAERELAEAAGIAFSQVHGPWRYPPRDGTEEERAERLVKMRRCIRATALLGCASFVIHPIMPFGPDDDPDPARLFQMNVDFFKALLPTARENGVYICLENMPMRGLSLSTPAQILRLVKALDDPLVKICLDTGHCAVFGIQPADALRELGDYVKVLHIHDNGGQYDEHRHPYAGVIHWEDFACALKETGYAGVLSLETSPHPQLNEEAYRAVNKALALIARQIADLAE